MGETDEDRCVFVPTEIARQAVEHGEDPTSSVIGQLCGYASMRWDPVPAGIFDPGPLKVAVERTLEWLQEDRPVAVTVPPGGRLVLVTDVTHMTPEVAQQLTDAIAAGSRALVFERRLVHQLVVLEAGAPIEVLHDGAGQATVVNVAETGRLEG